MLTTMEQHTKKDYKSPKTTIFSLLPASIIALSYKLNEGDGFDYNDPGDEGTDMQLTRQNEGFDNGYWDE